MQKKNILLTAILFAAMLITVPMLSPTKASAFGEAYFNASGQVGFENNATLIGNGKYTENSYLNSGTVIKNGWCPVATVDVAGGSQMSQTTGGWFGGAVNTSTAGMAGYEITKGFGTTITSGTGTSAAVQAFNGSGAASSFMNQVLKVH